VVRRVIARHARPMELCLQNLARSLALALLVGFDASSVVIMQISFLRCVQCTKSVLSRNLGDRAPFLSLVPPDNASLWFTSI